MKYFLTAICFLFLLGSCNSGADSDSYSANHNVDGVVDFTENGHAPRNTSHIDSLANDADFLSSGEGVGVLVAYADIIAEAKSAGNLKLMYETMRKFVDLYNIVSHNHKSDFKRDIAEVSRRQGPDIEILVGEFREQLADYDDASGQISFAPKTEKEASDSTSVADSTAVNVATNATLSTVEAVEISNID